MTQNTGWDYRDWSDLLEGKRFDDPEIAKVVLWPNPFFELRFRAATYYIACCILQVIRGSEWKLKPHK